MIFPLQEPCGVFRAFLEIQKTAELHHEGLRELEICTVFVTVEPRLSGLVGTSVKSPDNRESG